MLGRLPLFNFRGRAMRRRNVSGSLLIAAVLLASMAVSHAAASSAAADRDAEPLSSSSRSYHVIWHAGGKLRAKVKFCWRDGRT